MIEKSQIIKHVYVNMLSMVQISVVLFGFVKDPASYLGRRRAGMRKCRERQDAGSDTPSIHSDGYASASSDEHPTCLAGFPTKSDETARRGFEQPTG